MIFSYHDAVLKLSVAAFLLRTLAKSEWTKVKVGAFLPALSAAYHALREQGGAPDGRPPTEGGPKEGGPKDGGDGVWVPGVPGRYGRNTWRTGALQTTRRLRLGGWAA